LFSKFLHIRLCTEASDSLASDACIQSLGDYQCSGGLVFEWQESFEKVFIAACLGDARDIENVT
jgi:hypothetical protein